MYVYNVRAVSSIQTGVWVCLRLGVSRPECVCAGFLPQSKDMKIRSAGYYKLLSGDLCELQFYCVSTCDKCVNLPLTQSLLGSVSASSWS